jgi:DNA-binding PadR family transcriptional regulator
MLVDGPKHGYEVIRALEEHRGVRPSAGSVYPTLQLLEDGGLVSSEQVEGKRVYTITESGRELLANRVNDGADNEEPDDEHDARRRANQATFKLGAAIMSARGADAPTLEKIRVIIDKARKEIYAVLAADES